MRDLGSMNKRNVSHSILHLLLIMIKSTMNILCDFNMCCLELSYIEGGGKGRKGKISQRKEYMIRRRCFSSLATIRGRGVPFL